MNIFTLEQIKANLNIEMIISEIEKGFVDYSKGDVVVPPVGHISFQNGDCHIKYGHIKNAPYFVIKIATGFSSNRSEGLSVCNGLMIIMDAKTGHPVAMLEDEGFLTDIRTAIAGLIASKYLAPKNIKKIGIVGSGGQAHLQLEYLKYVTSCRDVLVWNRDIDKAMLLKNKMERLGFNICISSNLKELIQECRLIVTATSSKQPLIKADWVKKGTHITAVGADAPGKQELDENIIPIADICAVDSYSQCMDHGEVSYASKKGLIKRKDLIEIGEIIAGESITRINDSQITIADLTGVAVQDIKIALCVYNACISN